VNRVASCLLVGGLVLLTGCQSAPARQHSASVQADNPIPPLPTGTYIPRPVSSTPSPSGTPHHKKVIKVHHKKVIKVHHKKARKPHHKKVVKAHHVRAAVMHHRPKPPKPQPSVSPTPTRTPTPAPSPSPSPTP
jgi:hypothetical protein